ncbi:MAG: NAD(P)/FAD-dependent oxidoreductase [Candidatus Methanomethylicia archaeon]
MYDVIVVGCGPAGALALKHCSELGLKVIGVERRKMPRHKPCAGVLYPRVLEDFKVSREAIASELLGVRIIAPSGNTATISFYEAGAIVYRDIFDHLLTLEAVKYGAKIIDGLSVNSVKIVDDRCIVKLGDNTNIEGKFIIACDGVYSTISRLFNKSWSKEDLAATLQAVVKTSINDKKTINKYFEVYYDSIRTPEGWTWIAERKDDVLVGLGYPLKHVRSLYELKYKLNSFLKFRFGRYQVLRYESYMIPISGPKHNLIINSRIILAGDAGGFVRSDTGEGIYYAMYSGLAAAESVKEHIEGGKQLKEIYHSKLQDYGLNRLHLASEAKNILTSNSEIEKYIDKIKILSETYR